MGKIRFHERHKKNLVFSRTCFMLYLYQQNIKYAAQILCVSTMRESHCHLVLNLRVIYKAFYLARYLSPSS